MSDYFTEHDDVLENKLGITNADILKEAESKIVTLRLVELPLQKPMGDFDFQHLKNLHYYLFSDIYPFAGQIRQIDIAKGGSVFCYVQNIETMQEVIFDSLKKEHVLVGFEKEMLVQRLAYYAGELNALHPFREGNGRTIRAFLNLIAQNAGFTMHFSLANAEELLEADIATFAGDLKPLVKVYENIID